MKLLPLLTALTLAAATGLAHAQSAPAIKLRVGTQDQAANSVTIQSFDDITVWIDGKAPAASTLELTNSALVVGDQVSVGLPLDDAMQAALTAGLANFAITDQDCEGKILQPPGERDSTCYTTIQARSNTFQPLAGNLRLMTGDYIKDVALSGLARHFEPLDLELVVASGNPGDMRVDGTFMKGNLGDGDFAYSAPVTFRVNNKSAEFGSSLITTALTDNSNFVILNDGCANAVLAPLGSCTFQVEAKRKWWGTGDAEVWVTASGLSGPLRVGSYTDPNISLSKALHFWGYNFDRPRLALTVTGGNPAAMEVVGPTQPSYSANVSIQAKNLSTEYPTGTLISAVSAASGPGAYEFVSNGCAIVLAAEATCDVTVRARSPWFGAMTGAYTLSGPSTGGPVSATQALAGTARHFDLPNLGWTLVSGTAAAMNVVGWKQGVVATSGYVTWRLRNASTEESSAAVALTLTGSSFEWGTNGCAGVSLGLGATCDVQVRATATANGALATTMTAAVNNSPTAAMSGTASGFYTFAWNPTAWGTCSLSCGGGTHSRTVSCKRSDGAAAPDTSCDGAKPPTSESCNTQSCCTPSWYVYAQDGCSASCGGGWSTRYWTDGCGNGSADSVSCNTQSCCASNAGQSCSFLNLYNANDGVNVPDGCGAPHSCAPGCYETACYNIPSLNGYENSYFNCGCPGPGVVDCSGSCGPA